MANQLSLSAIKLALISYLFGPYMVQANAILYHHSVYHTYITCTLLFHWLTICTLTTYFEMLDTNCSGCCYFSDRLLPYCL